MLENIIAEKKSGTVKWFDYKKGYGFITPDEKSDDKDIFVHITALQDANIVGIKEGQRVIFSTYKDRKRIAAYILKIIS